MTKKDIVRLFIKKQALPKWQFNLIVFISLPFVLIKKPAYLWLEQKINRKTSKHKDNLKIT